MADLLMGIVGTFFIVATLSVLWKDNIVFRFGQAAVMGAATAHYMIMSATSIQSMVLSQMQLIPILGLILGLMMYTRLFSKISWVSKYPSSVLVGVGIGVMLAGTIKGQILQQVGMTLGDIQTALFTTGDSVAILNSILIFIGVVTSLVYFLFTIEHKGTVGILAKVGRVFLMISLGANFSGELVWYQTQMIGRLMFIIQNLLAPLGLA
ncbi:MAG TPA: hypothetical protein VMW22_02565 [Candidatus Desulfaltia sp.]|nr:hypothetical protein [Candidatus Desulfaltia sp.]